MEISNRLGSQQAFGANFLNNKAFREIELENQCQKNKDLETRKRLYVLAPSLEFNQKGFCQIKAQSLNLVAATQKV